MSSLLKKISLISISLVILTSCEDNTSTEPPTQEFPDYYPGGVGTTFEYSLIEKDSAGNIIQTGTRDIRYSGTVDYRGRNYTAQDDSLDFGSQSNVATYLFRKTNTGVFYAVDTSQIAQLIPDTLKQFVTLRDEMQLLFYPLTSGSSWSLYRITAKVQPGIEVKILDIIAKFESTEQILLTIDSVRTVFPSRKVSYTLELFTRIGSPPEIYSAFMWYVQNVGLVKFEGNQFVVNIGGGGISFEPSPNILTQEMIEYNIIK